MANQDIIINDKNIVLGNDVGVHNSIYRGKNLTSTYTLANLSSKISSQDWSDLFIGDYVILNSHTWRIAGFDYFLLGGDTVTSSHHIVFMSDSSLKYRNMNSTDITTGAYIGSAMWSEEFSTTSGETNQTILNDFGSSHILSHREILANAVGTDGKSSSWTWITVPAGNLCNEMMVYGANVWSSGFDVGTGLTQFPLFRLNPRMINISRFDWWLSSVQSSACFCNVGLDGGAQQGFASNSNGVRPYCVFV